MKRSVAIVNCMKFLLVSILIGLCGCVQVPMTDISIPLSNGRLVRVKAPKDSEIDGLVVDFKNGTLELKRYRARMNPEIIAASGMAHVDLLRAYSDLVNSGIAAGVKAATKGVLP